MVLGFLIDKYEDVGPIFVRFFLLGVRIFASIPFVLMPLLGLLYVAARLTTIILAFMNLASLPAGGFQAVHWTTLIPHL
jgi:hypothetical protein